MQRPVIDYENGTMLVDVDGKPEVRSAIMERGNYWAGSRQTMHTCKPALHSNERLLETIDGQMEIVTVRDVPEPWKRAQGYYGEVAPPAHADEWNAQRYRKD